MYVFTRANRPTRSAAYLAGRPSASRFAHRSVLIQGLCSSPTCHYALLPTLQPLRPPPLRGPPAPLNRRHPTIRALRVRRWASIDSSTLKGDHGSYCSLTNVHGVATFHAIGPRLLRSTRAVRGAPYWLAEQPEPEEPSQIVTAQRPPLPIVLLLLEGRRYLRDGRHPFELTERPQCTSIVTFAFGCFRRLSPLPHSDKAKLRSVAISPHLVRERHDNAYERITIC